jgi:hypothetical protein
MGFESSMQQWQDGLARLEDAPRGEVRVLERVTDRIYAELRRRLGSTFSTDELVDLYESGTGWAQQLAMQTAPDDPWAWEPRVVVDGAGLRYLREAADYAGGRRLMPDA